MEDQEVRLHAAQIMAERQAHLPTADGDDDNDIMRIQCLVVTGGGQASKKARIDKAGLKPSDRCPTSLCRCLCDGWPVGASMMRTISTMNCTLFN